MLLVNNSGGIIVEVNTCPQCGSKHIQHENSKELVLDSSSYICKVCGYKGSPLILEKYEGVFQGIKSSVPGFIGPWEIQFRLDDGKRKTLEVIWEDARDCIRSLDLKKGDRIAVTIDEKIWCIDKIEK